MPARKTTTKRGPGRPRNQDPLALAREARAARNARIVNESPEQKFKRLASERMDGALTKLRQIKATASYPHSTTEASRVVTALKTAVSEVERAFYPPLSPLAGKKGGFRLDDDDRSQTY